MPEPENPRHLGDYLRQAARRYGDAPAVEEEGRATSFRQLLEQATACAAYLQALGVAPGDRVAIISPKTTDAITSVFGVLLAGAVYVPIQPRWPAARIEATVADCEPRAIVRDGKVTVRETGFELPWREALAWDPTSFAAPAVSAEQPAVVLFTSGSTGRPKGVTLPHRAVGAFVEWCVCEIGLTRGDRIAVPAPLSFDLSTLDVLGAPLGGATCVIVPEQIAWMPRFLTRFLEEERITAWYSVPSILAGMLNEGGLARRSYPALRTVLFAGEVFAPRQLASLQAAAPQAAFYNLYGPTETNVVTWYQVPPSFEPTGPLPIGKACPYARVRLTGEGELLAAGASLMSGYWNQPEETRNAILELEGDRYYRTGDRAAVDADGNYVFLGRADRQVKRRGFRIELGEIEAVLLRHAGVRETAVVATTEDTEGTAITAFIAGEPGRRWMERELKEHCAELLPSYMLPDRIVFLEALPKGSRGKIDYSALRVLVPGRHGH